MRKKIIVVVLENGRRVEKELEVVLSGEKSLLEAARDAINTLGSAITVYDFFHRNSDGTKGDKIKR